MKKKTLRIAGILMAVLAVAFVVYALNHPEWNFPWGNAITWTLYGLYALATMLLLIAPGTPEGKAEKS